MGGSLPHSRVASSSDNTRFSENKTTQYFVKQENLHKIKVMTKYFIQWQAEYTHPAHYINWEILKMKNVWIRIFMAAVAAASFILCSYIISDTLAIVTRGYTRVSYCMSSYCTNLIQHEVGPEFFWLTAHHELVPSNTNCYRKRGKSEVVSNSTNCNSGSTSDVGIHFFITSF